MGASQRKAGLRQEKAEANYWHDTRELQARVEGEEARMWALVQRAEAAEERACLVEAQLNDAVRLRDLAQDQLANMTAALSVCLVSLCLCWRRGACEAGRQPGLPAASPACRPRCLACLPRLVVAPASCAATPPAPRLASSTLLRMAGPQRQRDAGGRGVAPAGALNEALSLGALG